jgi:ABC-type transport system involved in multi-copper enzyme maturation permease subunit
MLARELAIGLRARLTWLQAALSALLVGHGFVLAIDLYSAGSRSALGNRLLAQQFDPLLGIVRPTVGGLYLAISLLAPLVAARTVAIEKERRTFRPLLLQTNAPLGVLASKLVAALVAVGLQLVAPVALLALWRALGGHLAMVETVVALSGYFLYLILVSAIAMAAAAWTESLAQAATLALLVIAASWAIDASEGFVALAWLGRALDWSVTTHLQPMERGILALGASAWMLLLSLGALAIAWVGMRFDLPRFRRALWISGLLVGTVLLCALSRRTVRSFDLTEDRRASLPPAAAQALAAMHEPLALEMYLDRDDARRRQIETDVISRLRIARPDLQVRAPNDERPALTEGERQEGYGRVVAHVGTAQRETYSSSPDEIVRLFFEAVGRPVPDLAQREYPGFPLVIDGARRTVVLVVAYFGLPLVLLIIGWLMTSRRRKR